MEKMKTIEKLVILDHCTNEVHIYICDPEADINEEYIENLGHHCSNCSWMFGEDISIIEHKELLT